MILPPGARVEATHSIDLDPTPLTRPQRVALLRDRADVRAQILTCTRCPLSMESWVYAPVPFRGPTPARYVIVGEAPGQKENRAGRPFIGPAGGLLASMLADAGLDIDQALLVNTVSCLPAGTPEDSHVHACRPNLHAQLALAHTPFTLLAGGVALSSFRPDLRVSAMNGHVILQNNRVLMPVLHPAYVLRNRKVRGDVVAALEGFRHLLRGDLAPSHLVNTRCASGCGGEVVHYDPELVGWCAVHWPRRQETPTEKAWVKDRVKASKVAAMRKRVAAKRQGVLT